MRGVLLLLLATILGWATPASALKPGKHRSITRDRCRDAGLPRDFCERAAMESYNTDAHEWDDMSAHAQRPDGASTCAGADLAAARLWDLGGELARALDQLATAPDDEAAIWAATALGRAAHTIQDNCAHSGMPNPQHAWYSLSDFCSDSERSPDIRPEAVTCAVTETDALMRAVAEAVAGAGVAGELGPRSCREDPWDDNNQRGPCEEMVLPGPWGVCSFFEGAETWDGTDGRWNNDRVGPWLQRAFADGVSGASGAPSPICGSDPDALAPSDEYPAEDVSGGPTTCTAAHLLCLGKVDSTDDFFADDEDAPEATAGCAAAPGSSGAGWLWLLVAVFAIRRRSRPAANR